MKKRLGALSAAMIDKMIAKAAHGLEVDVSPLISKHIESCLEIAERGPHHESIGGTENE